MFYYIDQPGTPSFPIGMVKTKSDFIIRTVETGLGRRILVVAVISVDAYPFLSFSDLTGHLEDKQGIHGGWKSWKSWKKACLTNFGWKSWKTCTFYNNKDWKSWKMYFSI